MSRTKTPASNHPWYGPKGRGQNEFPPGYLRGPRRTISDELRDVEMSKMGRTERVAQYSADEDIRASRDPSYYKISEGAGMRKPVRYD